MNEQETRRRAFVRSENIKLGKFLEVEDLVRWSREYRCGCGFRCNAPGEIFDHSIACVRPQEKP